ncbi:MAG: efflux transporter outer membrane subunit [Xanthobacteraceae bacterium]|nr:efflux transporter outer membrane subunit [Xanthobacteraceae bacterium]
MPKPHCSRWVALALALPVLGGCALGPDFVEPDSSLPANTSFTGQPLSDAHLPRPADPTWWNAFGDPVLTGLENRIATANLDVRTATIRIAESRYQRGATAAAQFPSINGDAKYQRELYSQNGIVSLIAPLLGPAGANGLSIPAINDYTPGLDMSWELDLWGRVRRQVESADAQLDQAEDRRRDVLVSSLAELARDYIQLRGTQEQIRIAESNLTVDREILQLAQQLQQKGVRSGLDAENAAAQVEGVRAQLPSLRQQEIQYRNAIAMLLDLPPSSLDAELSVNRAGLRSPPRVPLGIPSELARRRPDIRMAEDQLHAATASIGVAVASFYPKFQINGSVGLDALEFSNLFKASSLQYMAGPSVTLPIFDGARLKSMLELSEAQQAEAALTYHKTVLQAWHEVVNAIAAYRLEQARRARLRAQLDHTRAALDLARSRYNDGVTDFLTVLDAERSLLQNEQQFATSTTNVSLDLVTLFKALGGGWEQTFSDPSRLASRQ